MTHAKIARGARPAAPTARESINRGKGLCCRSCRALEGDANTEVNECNCDFSPTNQADERRGREVEEAEDRARTPVSDLLPRVFLFVTFRHSEP